MFSQAVWKAFLTSLGGISTVGAFDPYMICKAYASYVSHPSWCVVVMKWGISWMFQVLDWSPALKNFTTPFSGTHISLISIAGSIFKQWLVAFFVFYSTHLCAVVMIHKNPWWLLSNHLMLNLFSYVTYAVTAYIQTCHGVWSIITLLVCIVTSLGVLWHLSALDNYLQLPALYRNLVVPMWCLLLSTWLKIPSHY